MHIIIGMPPHIIITGMPAAIIDIMRWQQAVNISIDIPAIGIISHIMPLSVILQVIVIIGIGIGIMPPIIGIIPFIIPAGIIPPGIMPPGIMPPIIGIGIMAIIGIVSVAILLSAAFIFRSIGSVPRAGISHGEMMWLSACRRNHSRAGDVAFLRAIGETMTILETLPNLLSLPPENWMPHLRPPSPHRQPANLLPRSVKPSRGESGGTARIPGSSLPR